MLLLLWPLAAFGGRGAATAIPFSVSCILLALVLRFPLVVARHGAVRTLDLSLLAIALLTVVQAVPAPRAIVDVVSPHDAAVRGALSLDLSAASAWLPLSIDGQATHHFFLLVVPEHSGGQYLKALARISRFFRDAAFRRKLTEGETLEDVIRAIEEEDAKL